MDFTAPQRSRRLSASGMAHERQAGRAADVRLKEADAFQRLVFKLRTDMHKSEMRASKKQTPFSVWY